MFNSGIVLLAAGCSKRFGSSKLLYNLGEKPMVQLTMEALKTTNLPAVVIYSDPAVAQLAKKVGLLAIHNKEARHGQSASVRLGTSHFRFRRSVMFIPADQPMISAETIVTLNDIFKGFPSDKILSCHSGGKRCAPVVFGRKFFKELLELKGDVGGRDIIFRHPDSLVIHELRDEIEAMDIDTEDDLKVLTGHMGFVGKQSS